MRKILAGLLATSMIVSMSAMVSAATAVSPSIDITLDKIVADITAPGVVGAGATGIAGKAYVKSKIKGLKITTGDGTVINVPLSLEKEVESAHGWVVGAATALPLTDVDIFTASELQAALVGKNVSVDLEGKVYKGTFVKNGSNVKLQFDGAAFSSATSLTQPVLEWDNETVLVTSGLTFTPDTVKITTQPEVTFTPDVNIVAAVNKGDAGETIETEKEGDMKDIAVSNVFKCYSDGSPIPLTEKDTGATKDLNNNGGVQSGQTLYFMVRDDTEAAFSKLGDDSFWKMKISKSNNGKYVKSVEDVTKTFSSDLYDASEVSDPVRGTGGKRHRYIKVVLNEIYTDDEYKIGLDVRLTATDAAVRAGIVTKDETLLKVKDFSFYMKNIVKSADNDWVVGITGLMLDPMLNDWNTVTYMDEVDDVAFVRFFGDSDVGKFYAKLSTKWTHDDYAAYFNDQDAFYFEFTGSPKLSSTSRADLQIYDPFTDIDGNSTFDASTATIYQIVDGDLIDVTDSFTYGEGENGENAFITRTRFLGSYIICEKPVDEAVGSEDIDDLMPDDEEIPVAPITPDTNAGGKNPANTGRYN